MTSANESNARFIEMVLGGRETTVAYASPYMGEAKDGTPAVKHADFRQDRVSGSALLATASRLSEQGLDVWFTPAPRVPAATAEDARRRTKDTSAPSSVVWADVDHPLTDDQRRLVDRLDATLVCSGTPGHFHVYVHLDAPAAPDVTEYLNRAMRAALDGDAKHSSESLLRVPGTANHKARVRGGQALPVTVQRLSGTVHTPAAIAEALEVADPGTLDGHELSPTASRVEWSGEVIEPVRPLRGLLAEYAVEEPEEGARSEQTMRLVTNALEWGFSVPEIMYLAQDHKPTQERAAERNGDWASDVLRIIDKYADLHPHTGKTCGAAECPNAPEFMQEWSEPGSDIALELPEEPEADAKAESELSPTERQRKRWEEAAKDKAKEELLAMFARDTAKKAHATLNRLEGDTDDVADLLAEIDAEDASGADLRPQVGRFSNTDHGLFYAGTINGLYGDGGTGKSLYLGKLVVEALEAGQRVVYWEFDNNSGKSILRRLMAQGASRQALVERLHIFRSEEDMDRLDSAQRKQVGLVVLDALTPAIGALGLEVNHPTGTDTALRTFMAPFTILGACGVFIDHVGHEEKGRQSGSIRKSQAVQGALYRIETEEGEEPRVGGTGYAMLVLAKDNQGHAGPRDRVSAQITYDSTQPGRLDISVDKPGVSGDGEINLTLETIHDVDSMLEKAKLTESEQEDLIFEVLSKMGGPTNKAHMHQKLKDMKLKSAIGKDTVGIRLDSLAAQDRVVSFKGYLPGTNTGRKSDVYVVAAGAR